jgi:hypothetical protein
MITCVLAIGLAIVTGCGSQPGVSAAPPASRPAPAGPLLLAQFDNGVGAIAAGSTDPVWTDPDAVAALDGSAVFSVHHSPAGDELTRVDPDTGSAISSWPLPAGMVSISAVAPGGRWVALTDRQPGYGVPQGRASTELVVFDSRNGVENHRVALPGDVQPEAFSVDGKSVFVLAYHGDHYRVQTIELATGQQWDTSGRDKTVEREDMHGTTVRGVLNADHTLLATLYRNPGDAKEPAFVHILDLQNGWAYCADLPPPFGTGPVGTDRIELTPADTAIVSTTQGNRVAEIHIDEVHEPGVKPVTVDYRSGPVDPAEPASASAPGFGHVIATLG